MKSFFPCIFSLLLAGCCSFVSKGEFISYRGRLINLIPPDSIEIFSAHRGRSVLDGNGNLSPGLSPVIPDSNGFFIVGATTPSHDDCETPGHWEGGPLEILIRGNGIEGYRDTLSKEELKALPQLDPDSIGIKLGSSELGVWQLPDITLIPK